MPPGVMLGVDGFDVLGGDAESRRIEDHGIDVGLLHGETMTVCPDEQPNGTFDYRSIGFMGLFLVRALKHEAIA
jgi:hypothetical protein